MTPALALWFAAVVGLILGGWSWHRALTAAAARAREDAAWAHIIVVVDAARADVDLDRAAAAYVDYLERSYDWPST